MRVLVLVLVLVSASLFAALVKFLQTTTTAMMKRKKYSFKFIGSCFGGGGPSGGMAYSHGACWVRGSSLGEGGFGDVYLAKTKPSNQQSKLPRLIVVKSATMEQSWTLKSEKQVLCELRACPHVVQCYGDEVTETREGEKIYNILLEYCSGLSLDHQIRKFSGRGLPQSHVKLYTRDIVRGLKVIHSKGYIHCDIKPDNILLVPGTGDRSGGFVAKLADFGAAKSLFDEHEGEEDLRGTPQYMSPELVRDKRPRRPADIWALGCSIVEMLSGKPAWGYSDRELLLQIIGYSDLMPKIPENISKEARDFLGKCLDRNSRHRWSAGKLLEHPFLSRA